MKNPLNLPIPKYNWIVSLFREEAGPEQQESPSPRELDLAPDKWWEFWDGEGGSSNAELRGHRLAAPNSFFGSRWLLLVSITAAIA